MSYIEKVACTKCIMKKFHIVKKIVGELKKIEIVSLYTSSSDVYK